MLNKFPERKNLLENSINLLESILKKFGIQKETKPIMIIQNRIRSYKRELEITPD